MRVVVVIVIVAMAGLGVMAILGGRDREPVRATLSLTAALGTADTAGYHRAYEGREFTFPDDHGPHEGFRTEWWYFTGNLESEDGAPLGYELTFFRSALAPPDTTATARNSPWAANYAFMAHLAVTDVQGERFFAFDRFAREAAGLAGASARPFRVWTEDWSAASADAAGVFPLRLQAETEDVAIDILIQQGKPPVLNGEAGLSRKGPEPGNASYYYSLTRMPTTGTVRVGGRSVRVSGNSWMDREWSTSGLSEGVAGWDWFALQLDDGSELMLYQLRRENGTATAFSAGTFTHADGSVRGLEAAEFAIDVLDFWRSPLDGARYPARWRLRVPSESLDVMVTPLLANQELNLAVRYWEGTARVDGQRRGVPTGGRAYVELTGYAEGPSRSDSRAVARRGISMTPNGRQ